MWLWVQNHLPKFPPRQSLEALHSIGQLLQEHSKSLGESSGSEPSGYEAGLFLVAWFDNKTGDGTEVSEPFHEAKLVPIIVDYNP